MREFLEFCNSDSAQKTRVMTLPDGGKSLTKCIRLDTIPECNGWTDRQMDGQTDLP